MKRENCAEVDHYAFGDAVVEGGLYRIAFVLGDGRNKPIACIIHPRSALLASLKLFAMSVKGLIFKCV